MYYSWSSSRFNKHKSSTIKPLLCLLIALVSIDLLIHIFGHNKPSPNPNETASPNTGSNQQQQLPQKPVIDAFVGIYTGYTKPGASDKYDYDKRRKALRQTWVPIGDQLKETEQQSRIVVRFIIGYASDPSAGEVIDKDQAQFGDYLRLPLTEGYLSLTHKTLVFFSVVLEQYEPKYIVKVDDDVYFHLNRLPMAIQQWDNAGADYIGCMKRGGIIQDPRYRWYEPQHVLLGDKDYFTHAWGSIYVLSNKASKLIVSVPEESLRHFSNEDVTLGSWMMALNVTHYDDRRLCSPHCSENSLAVYDIPKCAGLCDAGVELLELHQQPSCTDVPSQLALQLGLDFSKEAKKQSQA